MHDAVSIANIFVDMSIKEGNPLTNMKLQKLVYIANGVSLAINDAPLIIEHIEVWPYGPVIPSVYHIYKAFGNSTIKIVYPLGDIPDLEASAKKSVLDAWEIGSKISATRLSNWTHNADSPWTKAKAENKNYIPDEYMRDYFRGFLNT
jgi:uncharacterized phage-associated protein